MIHQSEVEILSLPDDASLPDWADWPRMSCYIGRAEAMKDPELKMLAPAIQWLHGKTWEEKLAFANERPELIGEALDLNKKYVHGIVETVKFNCRRCRIEHNTKLELNALTFFQ